MSNPLTIDGLRDPEVAVAATDELLASWCTRSVLGSKLDIDPTETDLFYRPPKWDEELFHPNFWLVLALQNLI